MKRKNENDLDEKLSYFIVRYRAFFSLGVFDEKKNDVLSHTRVFMSRSE